MEEKSTICCSDNLELVSGLEVYGLRTHNKLLMEIGCRGREGFPKLTDLTLQPGTMPATNHASNQTAC